MANIDTIVPAVIQHFIERIMTVTPVGKRMHRFKLWDAEQMLADEGSRDRLFDVYASEDVPPERVTDGAKTVEYNIAINIDVCYHITRHQTAIGMRDFDVIQRAIINSDTSSLTGYQFPIFDSIEWVPGQDESNYRTMRIPVLIRVITTL